MKQERSLDRTRPLSREMDRDRRDRRGSYDVRRERDRRDCLRGSYDAFSQPAPRHGAGMNYEVVCKFFQSTGCKFGARCLYKHIGRRDSRVRSRSRSGGRCRYRSRSGSIDGFGRRTFYTDDDIKSERSKGRSSSIKRDKSLLGYDEAEQKKKESKDRSYREPGRSRDINVSEDKNKSLLDQKAEKLRKESFNELGRCKQTGEEKNKEKCLNGKRGDPGKRRSPSESEEILREKLLSHHQNTSTRKMIGSVSPSPPLMKFTRTVTIRTNSVVKRDDKKGHSDLKSVTQIPEKSLEKALPEKKESPPPRCSKCGQKIRKRRVTE